MPPRQNPFNARATLPGAGAPIVYYRLAALTEQGITNLERLPFTVRIFLENLLRHCDEGTGALVTPDHVRELAQWRPGAGKEGAAEFAFLPARVVLQDFTGVPCVVDLAAMRSAVKGLGGDPAEVNPLVPADLVIDHSVQVDYFGTTRAFLGNVEREYERNGERYALLRWAQQAFRDFQVVPPGTGIVHQVNLEYLGKVVQARADEGGETVAYPDTLVGTDSHTTMINGLGILGWGVGGIEAEAVLLGQPLYLVPPLMVGVRLSNALPEGSTATDLVLRVTELLRKQNVVGQFVEFTGPGLSSLALPDRATISNMCPEYGATAAFFPVDDETLRYLRSTGRDDSLVQLVERYCKEQGLFRTDATPDPQYDTLLELDLTTIEPSVAGPRRPQDRVALAGIGRTFQAAFADRMAAPSADGQQPSATQPRQQGAAVATAERAGREPALVDIEGEQVEMGHGAVAIAAITSCTNTSNPSVMIGAGLLAKHAVERGLRVKPYVKTSLAPGSRAVTDYLTDAGLLPYLEALHFHLVGYGCTTCIAGGTPVLLANGTARRIDHMPSAGGAVVFGPTADGQLGAALQTEAMAQGERECISLVLEDGRTLECTPDHELLTEDGRWERADELVIGQDRVVVGLEAPLDEPGDDEAGYVLHVGNLVFTLDTPQGRARTLAFARLLGHLLSDGSISVLGQARMQVGQALDRDVVLGDIELVTGFRPAGTRDDEQQWTIVLPKGLSDAVMTLPGVRVGRRIHHATTLPEFVLDESCPVAVLREFLGGMFGADGHAPVLHRWGEHEYNASLEPPVYSQSATPAHVGHLERLMARMVRLLARCGVKTDGAQVYRYPTRRATSTYLAAQNGVPRIEVRLVLADGLSFVEHVGFRYSVDKAMRASAAAVYWRLVDGMQRQRLWRSARLEELPQQQPALSFSQARRVAATAVMEREPDVSPHYALLEGHDRFTRLPEPTSRKFQPLHRDACDIPSPAEVFRQLGVRDWFAPLQSRASGDTSKCYCLDKEARALPTFSLRVVDRQAAGTRAVYDLAVDDLHAFIAGTVAVHNCIGNSGPLPEPVAQAVKDNDLVVAAVLSGNRNFEGRIHPQVRASFLASPPLVVAFALAGTVDIDLTSQPLGEDPNGEQVYLRDIWPSQAEISETLASAVKASQFKEDYAHVFEGDEHWRSLPVPASKEFEWDPDSTYVREPPFVKDMAPQPAPPTDIKGARVLVSVGDSVTTDHISPAGSIPPDSPAGRYLQEHDVAPRDFNSYGARRGNHEVMMRGTFGNIRLRNQLVPGKEGYWTQHLPDGEEMTIYDASMRYQQEGTPLLVIAGKEYGTGSSRDWAAKGALLLGIRATLAESYERIHRSNLVGMGVLPLQFRPGESRESLGLTGREVFDVEGIAQDLAPGKVLTVHARGDDGKTTSFEVVARLDGSVDLEYYRQGGILPAVLRRLAREHPSAG